MTYLNANHNLLTNINIPTFYTDIHHLYMKFFKTEPENINEISNQSLLLNSSITINNYYIYVKNWEICGITYIKDILNNNESFLTHKELKIKYNITTTLLQTIQIQKSIARTWTQMLKKCTTTSNINNNEDNIPIKIDNKQTTIDKVKCSDFYWHLIKCKHYTPKTTKKWSNRYPDFDNAEQKIWSRIF